MTVVEEKEGELRPTEKEVMRIKDGERRWSVG